MLDLVTKAEATIGLPAQQAWAPRMDRELDNLRAALRWSLDAGPVETALLLAGSVWRYWYARGHLTEGRAWLDEALARGEAAPAGARIKALIGAGALAQVHGEATRADTLLGEALSLAKDGGDGWNEAMARNLLGTVARGRDEFDVALEYYEAALARFRAIDDLWGQTLVLNNLGMMLHRQGKHEDAERRLGEGLTLARKRQDVWGASVALRNLAHVARRQLDLARAAHFYQESLKYTEALGDRLGAAEALTGLGRIAVEQDDPALAVSLHRQSLELSRATGDRRGIATALNNLGWALLAQGEAEGACQAGRESLGLRSELDDREGMAGSMELLADLAMTTGAVERAVTLWAAANTMRRASGQPLPSAEQAKQEVKIAKAKEEMGERFDTARDVGGKLSQIDAVVYALDPVTD
jgi:tetratricopeptide (TPR) repeat protein